MKKRLIACLMCLCMLVGLLPTAAFASGGTVATVDGKEYTDLQTAIDAASGKTVVLKDNVVLTAESAGSKAKPIVVSSEVTLDMNGKTISNASDIWVDTKEEDKWSLISVQKGGDLTITGNGTLKAKADDCYAVDLQYDGKCTIENGTFVGNISAVYVHDGHLTVNGGDFSIQQLADGENGYRHTLNCLDANYKNKTATITVTGGTFKNFNPENNLAEGAGTNFCAEGYLATKRGEVDATYYDVVPAVVKVGDKENAIYYLTLAEAITHAKTGETIQLLQGVTLESNAYFKGDESGQPRTLILDLGGHTLSGPDYDSMLIQNEENLTVQNGTIRITAEVEAAIWNSGALELNQVSIACAEGVGDMPGLICSSDGTAGLYDTEILTSFLVCNDDTATIVIHSGTFAADPRNGSNIKLAADSVASTDAAGHFVVAVLGEETATAKVVSEDATTYHTTLADAMKAAKTGDTVQLLKDVTLEKAVETGGKVSGITLDLNGHNIDGTAVTSSKGVVWMGTKYGWKPVEGTDDTMKIINSVPGQGGEIKGMLPVQFSTGDSRYPIPGEIGEDVTLTVIGDGADAVKLNSSAYLVYSEASKDYIKNGGFKVTAADGTERIYGSYANASGVARNGVVTMLHDYSGKEPIKSGNRVGVLDLGGNTFTYLNPDKIIDINYDNAGITIRNGTLTSTAEALSEGGVTALYNNTTLVLEHVTMNVPGNSYGIVTNGTNTGNSVTLKNSILNVPDGFGIYFPSDGNVTIENSKINANHFGVQMCAGSLTVTGDQTVITTTGAKQQKMEGDGPIVDGAAISIVKRDGYKDLGKVEISAGAFKSAQADAVKAYTFNNTDKTEGKWEDANTIVEISGGLFSSDPTAYLAEGKMAVPISQNGYYFAVEDAIASVEIVNGKTETKPAVGEYPDGAVTEEAAIAAAGSVTANLAGATGSVASGVDSAVVADAESKLGDKKPADEETVVLVQPYPEVTPAGSSVDGEKKTVTFNIVPKYNLIATHTGVTVMAPDDLTEDNSVVLKEAQPLTVTTPAEVTLTLPEGFAAENATVYIKHEASNGKIYYYTAKVASDRTITFTTKHGFSPFTVSTVNEAMAEVSGVGYPTLQEAVDAVANNGTITLLKNVDAAEVVTVSRDITFTVDANGKTFDKNKNIVAGSNTTVTVSGDTSPYTYTFDYTAPGVSGYLVNTSATSNGSVSVSTRYASAGATVTVTATSNAGYELDTLTVTDQNGKEIKLTDKGSGKYIFTMPASSVTVKASFRPVGSSVKNPFTDVAEQDYFYQPVLWAVEKGITNGISATTFSPNGSCTRAQMVTFLWRANGSPKATGSTPFTDVSAGAYYYDAALWAVEKGITNGTSASTFSPDAVLTRSQAVTFLYRAAGSPVVSGNSFDDVDSDAWYANAVIWAVSEGVTVGTGGNHFSPDAPCTRGQIVTFLYRNMEQ